MELHNVRLSIDGDKATLTLHRPDHGNRLNVAMIDEMLKVCH